MDGLGFERMTLEASVTNAMAATQNAIATTGEDKAGQSEALAQLLDRLSQRLPVWRLAPGESHWPERSVIRVGPFDPVAPAAGLPDLPAPVRLLRRPVPLTVMATVPDGPPVQLRLDGTVHQVAWADGPARIEPEWWNDTTARGGRDYYRWNCGPAPAFRLGAPERCGRTGLPVGSCTAIWRDRRLRRTYSAPS